MFISIDIKGGLGNQLFMIFTALAYSIQHNVEPVFMYFYQVGNRHTYWETILSGLKHLTAFNPHTPITNATISAFKKYREPEFFYTDLPKFDENILLDGYFQSFRYFDMYKKEILDMMGFSEKRNQIREKYREYFEDKTCISIHFRMGDYKHLRHYHPIMNYEYYEKSLECIMSKIDRAAPTRVLYFCEKEDNDFVSSKIELMKTNYPPHFEFVKVDDTIPDYEQMVLISLCQHNIMSNSSFSWWGSYLNTYENAVVCYPSVWFGDHFIKRIIYGDLHLKTWNQIQANPIHWSEPIS